MVEPGVVLRYRDACQKEGVFLGVEPMASSQLV